MTETIGKVTLNLDKYPGEDYYCDGSVEDEILEIVKKYSTVEYDRIIAERKAGRSCIICRLCGKISWIFFRSKRRTKCWK